MLGAARITDQQSATGERMHLNAKQWDALTQEPAHPLILTDFALRITVNSSTTSPVDVQLALQMHHAELDTEFCIAVDLPEHVLRHLTNLLSVVVNDIDDPHPPWDGHT